MEVSDHSTHLKSVTDQANGLITEIQQLETQAKNKREAPAPPIPSEEVES